MKEYEILYAAAERMKSGFSPQLRRGGCGCFVNRVDPHPFSDLERETVYRAISRVEAIIGCRIDYWSLEHSGWTGPECTDDAVAALEIAADIAFCEATKPWSSGEIEVTE